MSERWMYHYTDRVLVPGLAPPHPGYTRVHVNGDYRRPRTVRDSTLTEKPTSLRSGQKGRTR